MNRSSLILVVVWVLLLLVCASGVYAHILKLKDGRILKGTLVGATRDMINFRVMVAGRKEPLFTSQAIQSIYDYSHGMPREICALGLNVLPLALVQRANVIDEDLVAQAVKELSEE